MPLVSTLSGVLHSTAPMSYEEASADTFVTAYGSYRASTVGSANVFLIAANASSCEGSHHQACLLLSSSVSRQIT